MNTFNYKTIDYQQVPLKKLFIWLTCMVLMMLASSSFAASTVNLGNMASSITSTFSNVALLITGGCYLSGIAFSVTAIMKFKQHKDNPSQMTIGTPVALVFIAAALLFLPSILDVASYTMFGPSGGHTSSPSGSVYSSPGS